MPGTPPVDASAPAIEAVGLSKRFGDREVVADVDLTIGAGTFFALLGPNGAGKSTTIRLLTGLLPATRGTTRILGLPVAPENVEFKRHVGVVLEELALFDRLTLVEHLVLAGRLHALPEDEARRRAEDLLGLLDLSDVRHVHAVEASHGMRKKTALGMALLPAPRVLFLDEPLTGLDPLAARDVEGLLARLAGRGVSVFLTSHDLHAVERLATRVAVIVGGRKVLDAERRELEASGATLSRRYEELVGRADRVSELPWLG